jgi:hypothetical protein
VNKNDFYKQLMTQYTFDSEKIRKNAKRTSFTLRNTMWLPLTTAAAVFISVFGGYMLLNNRDQNVPMVPTTSFAAGLSPEERVEAMKDNEALYNGGRFDASNKDMYLTFNEPMTFRQLNFALSNVSDTGNITVTRVWFCDEDASVAVDDAFDKNGGALYCGAQINTPMALFLDIQQCGYFLAAEVGGDTINADNFTPFTPPAETNAPTVPVVTTYPDSQAESLPNVPDVTVTQVPQPEQQPQNTDDADAQTAVSTDTDETTVPANPADAPAESTTPPETDVTEPSVDETVTEAPAETVTELPEETDPANSSDLPEVKSLELPIKGMIDARFIGKNDLLVLTKNSVMLYKVDMSADEPFYQTAAYVVTDPKITYIGDNGATAVIIGGDSMGSKNSLYLAKASALVKVDLRGQVTPDSVIRYALFEGSFGLINVSNLDVSTLYVADIVGTQVVFSGAGLPVSPDAAVMSFSAEGFIYAEGNVLYNYSYHTRQSLAMDCAFSATAVFCRAKDFKNFAVSEGNSTVVYNAATGGFTPAFEAQTLQFSNVGSDYFTDGTYYYRFIGSDIVTVTSDEYYNLSPANFTFYKIDTISQDSVTITED